MRLILRVGDREAEREVPLSTQLEESLRRIKLTRVQDPGSVLAHQATQEVGYLIRRDNLLNQIITELIQGL